MTQTSSLLRNHLFPAQTVKLPLEVVMSHSIAVPDNQIQPGQDSPKQAQPKDPDSYFTRKEMVEILQREIQYTQTMLGSRMTWYVTSQSFLMTAFAISGGSGHNFQWLAKGIIPGLGLVLSLIIFFSIGAAVPILIRQRMRALEIISSSKEMNDLHIIGFQVSSTNPTLRSRMAPQVVPAIFMIVWVAVLILVWNFTPNF